MVEEGDDDIQAFMTEIASRGGKKKKSEKLAHVRKDHAKMIEIVQSFGGKLSILVDKQRVEYMSAYEKHMQEVQRELLLLREKAIEVGNQKTRDDKIQNLKQQEEFFKHEALQYDVDSTLLRKKVRSMTEKMHFIEKERDWLIRKLRSAKKEYAALHEQYNQMVMEAGSTRMNNSQSLIDFSSVNEESNYSIEIERPQSKNVRRLLVGGGASSLPNLHTPSTKKIDMATNNALANNKFLSAKNSKKGLEREATGKFVVGKMKQDELRHFISDCLTKCRKGTYKKLNRDNRDLDSILTSCVELCNHPNYYELETERAHLAEQLISMPDTYLSLRFLMQDANNTFGIGDYVPTVDRGSAELMVSMVDDLGISDTGGFGY